MKKFNVTGLCVPNKHYMVDVSKKLDSIIRMIEDDDYFTINRARQYGKTTVFFQLDTRLQNSYTILSLSFEGVGSNAFSSDKSFVRFFIKKIRDELRYRNVNENIINEWEDISEIDKEDAFDYLSDKITKLCVSSDNDIILMIDEVDKSSDNQIFLDFLGMLRNKYLLRQQGRDTTFRSVILAGVYDIKNLKLKLRPNEERKYNSPWNIAANFDVDMSFNPEEIATMLSSYEQDYHTGMDIQTISESIYFYTNGYPYLVSWLCKWIDEKGNKCWSVDGVKQAAKEILKDRSTLFDDLIKNVENNSNLKNIIHEILLNGTNIPFSKANSAIELGAMFGILTAKGEYTAISNVLFETYLYNYIIVEELLKKTELANKNSSLINNGKLDMEKALLKFQEFMKAEHRASDEPFVEKNGRLLFLCFMKPIINGTGFYYVEPETRDNTRMDVVITYGGEEHIVELKIWHGDEYRQKGIRQLEEYMESRNSEKGYMLSFSFAKNKRYKAEWLDNSETDKRIYEVIV